MDINKIFESFKNEEVIESITNIIDSSIINLATFEKIVINSVFFNKKILNILKTEVEDIEKFQKDIYRLLYNKAYIYIDKINPDLKEDQEAINKRKNDKLIKALKYSLSFFEEGEEFEKCVKLKNILNIIENEK